MPEETQSDSGGPPVRPKEPETIEDLTAKILANEPDIKTEEEEDACMKVYREQDDFDDTDSDSDDEQSQIKLITNIGNHVEIDDIQDGPPEDDKTIKFGPIAKGELTLDDLPPVEKLSVSVPVGQLKSVGKIYSFVDQLVVVESIAGENVLNLDTLLFLSDGRAVGQVFDVIGPVKAPFYVLRFNNQQEIEDEHLTKGVELFCAPTYEDYTFFVFQKQIEDMMRVKGSDASWEHDLEPPEDEREYSDDEKERDAKKEKRNSKRKLQPRNPGDHTKSPNPSYVKTERHNPAGHDRHPRGPVPPPMNVYPGVPMYNPNVPPPGYNPWAHPRMTYPMPGQMAGLPGHYPMPGFHPMSPYAYPPLYTAPFGPTTSRPVYPGQIPPQPNPNGANYFHPGPQNF